jgi:hypothetical protein
MAKEKEEPKAQAQQERKSEEKFRCMANILTAGKNPDFVKDRIYLKSEIDHLPPNSKKKFIKIEALTIIQGADLDLVKELERLALENKLLSVEIDKLKKGK